MDYEISETIIAEKWEAELEKFYLIDKNSDIKIFDLFVNRYKKERLFSDYYHPTPTIFSYVSNEILKIPIDIN
jgi:hypothetical protein